MAEVAGAAADFLVIGGGIVGLSIARELRRRHPSARVAVLEKEARVAAHASGRNSGVLHAGFYYSPDSLKARFTRVGNERLTHYCLERGLPIRRCGKLVVATNDEELPRLEELARRGRANGVTLEMLSAHEARSIEPRAIVYERAIWSPTTSTVDPAAVMAELLRDVTSAGIEVRLGEAYRRRRGTTIDTSTGAIAAGFVVNAAGLHADAIARDFGFSRNHRILPFKGLYLYSSEPPGTLRTHIYPVPDPRFPFLGVHLTVAVDGTAKIGPTAMPAFWREQYGTFENFDGRELVDVLTREARLMATSLSFRRLAFEELRKYSRRRLVALASALATDVRLEQFTRWGRPGIRAQLYDVKKNALEMDFVIEGDEHSLHVLNAVSPGFTCALPFADHVVDQIDARK